MRSSIILTSLLATLALANPLDKRYLTTKVEVYTVWTTVTRGAEPTGYGRSKGQGYGRGGGRGRHRSSSAVAEPSVASSSADAVVPTLTPEASPSPSGETPYPSAPAEPSSEAPIPISEPAPSAPAEASSEAPIPTSEPAPAPVTSDTDKGVSPSAPAPSAPAASSPAPVPSKASSTYGQAILDQHNIHRANHTNTGPLTWSDALAATALKIANSCVYQHDTQTDKDQYNNGQGYGQNIGAGAPPEDVPAMITNGMYNDEAPFYEGLYGQDDPDMSNFKAWGHFSQIAWRSTKEIGCATVECGTLQKAGGTRPFFTVCNYAPPGNFGGEYTNVGTRLGKPTVSI